MSARELVVLGTAGQVPTRTRNHNGYLLRWDSEAVLFDPGEGTQRQLTLAGIAPPSITRIMLTHLHGDHCLGLPGVMQRLALHRVSRPVELYAPKAGMETLGHLLAVGASFHGIPPNVHAVADDGVVDPGPPFAVVAARLDHRVETFGWRIQEPDGRRMLPERLASLGVRGPDVGRLQREGTVAVDGRTVRLEDVSAPRQGQAFAFLMDTRPCAAAVELARDADLVVCESTFVTADAALAHDYGHMTAAQAAAIAAEAGARRLVLTHFSQRYPDDSVYLEEASPMHPDVIAARDLMRVPVPPRRERRAGTP